MEQENEKEILCSTCDGAGEICTLPHPDPDFCDIVGDGDCLPECEHRELCPTCKGSGKLLCFNNPRECPDLSLCKKCAHYHRCKLCDACEYQGMEWRPCDTYELCVFKPRIGL